MLGNPPPKDGKLDIGLGPQGVLSLTGPMKANSVVDPRDTQEYDDPSYQYFCLKTNTDRQPRVGR